jgi:hypothetical protein
MCGRLLWWRHRVKRGSSMSRNGFAGFGFLLVALLGCTPTVKVATDEPITINLNVNIRHEILVKVDRELDDVLKKDGELF